MACGCDEVETHVYARVVVRVERALHLELLLKVHLKLLVNVVHDRLGTKRKQKQK